MKIFVLYIFILIFVSSTFSQSQKRLLENAFEDSSVTLLEEFFENWRKEIPTINNKEYDKLNDTQKDVYDLFGEFYNPLDLKRMKLYDWEYTLYENVKYVIISDKIRYEFTRSINPDSVFADYLRIEYKDDSLKIAEELNDSISRKSFRENLFLLGPFNVWGKDSLDDFHPRVKFTQAKPLYLREYYNKIISEFLGDEFTPLGEGSIMNPAHSKGDSKMKESFLRNFIFVMISHWGDYWEVLTSPKVDEILFDRNRENAIVYYSFPYHAGYSVFTKTAGKWVFVRDKFTIMW